MHAVTKKRTRVGSKTQTRGRAVAAATATYDSSTAADQAAAADSFDQSNPSPWADQAKAAADAASAQAASQAAAQQTASDTAADDGKVSEMADNQSQAWHDQVLAMAQGENAFSLASAGSAAQLAAADAYFAAVGGQSSSVGNALRGVPQGEGAPIQLTGPGGDTPITLTGGYGNSHPIGSYWVGDTADSIDAVVSDMFRRGADPEAAIGPQGSWAYTWFGAGEGMPYGPIAAAVQPGLNMMSPDLQSAQPNVATPNVFGPQILAQTGASGGAPAPPQGGPSASAGAPTDTGNPAHSVPLNGNGEQTNAARKPGGLTLYGPDGLPLPGLAAQGEGAQAGAAEQAQGEQQIAANQQQVNDALRIWGQANAARRHRDNKMAAYTSSGYAALSVMFAEVADFWNGVTFGQSDTLGGMSDFAWEETGIAGSASAKTGQVAANWGGGVVPWAPGGALAKAGGALGAAGRAIQGAELLDDAASVAQGTARAVNGDVGGAVQAGLGAVGLRGAGKAAGNALAETAGAVSKGERNAAGEVLTAADGSVGGALTGTNKAKAATDDIVDAVDEVLDGNPSSGGGGADVHSRRPPPRGKAGGPPGRRPAGPIGW